MILDDGGKFDAGPIFFLCSDFAFFKCRFLFSFPFLFRRQV
jgi:hypothetical protein